MFFRCTLNNKGLSQSLVICDSPTFSLCKRIFTPLFLSNGRYEAFNSFSQLGMMYNKMYRRGFAFRHHCPFSLVHNNLQISECIGRGLNHCVIRVTFRIALCLLHMLQIVLVAVLYLRMNSLLLAMSTRTVILVLLMPL